jgi:hypothetical protein
VNKIKVMTGIFLTLVLLSVAACTPETVTSTVTKTSTVMPAAQTVTVTPAVQTVTDIQTQIVAITNTAMTQTSSTTKTMIISSTTTKTSTTTVTSTTSTSTTTFTPVTSSDGKLQVTSAGFPGGDTSYIRVKVKNLSADTLSARVTIQFLDESGDVAVINGVEQIKIVEILNLAAGAEKTFVQEVDRLDASSSAKQDEVVSFNISIAVIK